MLTQVAGWPQGLVKGQAPWVFWQGGVFGDNPPMSTSDRTLPGPLPLVAHASAADGPPLRHRRGAGNGESAARIQPCVMAELSDAGTLAIAAGSSCHQPITNPLGLCAGDARRRPQPEPGAVTPTRRASSRTWWPPTGVAGGDVAARPALVPVGRARVRDGRPARQRSDPVEPFAHRGPREERWRLRACRAAIAGRWNAALTPTAGSARWPTLECGHPQAAEVFWAITVPGAPAFRARASAGGGTDRICRWSGDRQGACRRRRPSPANGRASMRWPPASDPTPRRRHRI